MFQTENFQNLNRSSMSTTTRNIQEKFYSNKQSNYRQ